MGWWGYPGFGVRPVDVWIFDRQFGVWIRFCWLRCSEIGNVAWVGFGVSWRSGDGHLDLVVAVKMEPLELWR